MANSPSTNALLIAAGAGNREALNALLARHRESLRRLVAYRMDRGLAARFDASDVVQDVLLEADRRLADYLAAMELPFAHWLRGLAHDRLIDLHRRHRVAQRRSVDREQRLAPPGDDSRGVERYQAVDRDPTPAAAATRNELAACFQAAVDRLDPTDREVILLRHFEQLSNQEVARALALSEPAAGMRYLRALRKLRALLQDLSLADLPPGANQR